MSDLCSEIKRLIRFDTKNAVARSKEQVNILAKKYGDSASHASIDAASVRTDAELLKWCTKALMYEIDGLFALNEINPVIDQLLACSNICVCKPSEK